jgi:hypothetical protein
VTLYHKEKSPQISNLTNLSHVIIKVEVYRAQLNLVQCYNCQQFLHVWTNSKLYPIVYGALAVTSIKIALQRKKALKPNCCKYKLSEVKTTPIQHCGSSHAKEELLRRRAHKPSA